MMYFYNPRSLKFYQTGGAIADGQHIQQQIQVLQQQINNFNQAIANPDQSETVEYNADGTPTGELVGALYHVWGDPADNARDLQSNLLEKTNARLFLQNKLDNLKDQYKNLKSQALSRATVDVLPEDLVNRIMSHVQRGGATIQQEIQNLQQKIATLNQAIQKADGGIKAVYDGGIDPYSCAGIGNPTGEVTRLYYYADPNSAQRGKLPNPPGPSDVIYADHTLDQGKARAQQEQRIQQDKIDARDYFQTRLNQLQAFTLPIASSPVNELPEEVVANIMRHSQQMGGAGIQNDIQDLQQKIATLNQAIADADENEEAIYVNGIPTGEVEGALHYVTGNPADQQGVFDRIQQDKINARNYFKNKLDRLQARMVLLRKDLPNEVIANIMRNIQLGGIRKARYATSAYDGIGDLFEEPKFQSCESFRKKSTCVPHSECRWVGKGKTAHCELASATSTSAKGKGRSKVKAGKVSPKGRDTPGKRLVVSGRRKSERCKKGTRRNKKTGKCEKKK